MSFGLSAASPLDWLATLAGILIGGWFGVLGAKLTGKPKPMSVRGEGKPSVAVMLLVHDSCYLPIAAAPSGADHHGMD